jgi:hypothetical protein
VASTSHALVPNAARTAVLTVAGRIPVVHVETRRQFEALEQLKDGLHLRAVFLRVAARVERDEEVDLLDEFEAPPEAWHPEPPARWLPLEEADPASIAPEEFVEAVARWLEELRGAPVPPQRPAWARPGWLAQVSPWVEEQAGAVDEPRLVRQWPLSAVYRFESAGDRGGFYLKAVFSLFGAEPAVTEALAREHPGDVPDVVATDVERGWLLMRELAGESVKGEPRATVCARSLGSSGHG